MERVGGRYTDASQQTWKMQTAPGPRCGYTCSNTVLVDS
jgi:hypothetical protein